MAMKSFPYRVLQSFLLARQVNHFYWLHTDGDEPGGKASIENIEQIIERMIRLPINKYTVFVEDAPSVRGSFERYSDRIDIYIRDGQGEAWAKFTTVKEYCHALMDDKDDYSIDANDTLLQIKQFKGFGESPDSLSQVIASEKLAEIIALELIYPIEWRRDDMEARKGGELIKDISARRCVPSLWVEYALGDHYEYCLNIWKLLPEKPIEHNLPPL